MDTDAMAFHLNEAAHLAGLTPHTTRRWAKDLYPPHWGSGLYAFRDVVALRTLSRLRSKFQVSRQQLVRVGAFLNTHFQEPWSRLRFGVGPKRKVYFWNPDLDCWIGAMSGQVIAPIALDRLAPEVERDVRKLRKRDARTIGMFARKRGVCGNKERIAGTRITIKDVRDAIEDGASVAAILRAFPTLKPEDVTAVKKLSAA